MKKLLALLIAIFSLALPTLALDITDGAIVKTADNPDVYIVKYQSGKRYKRLVLNPQVFQSYGHLRWEDLLTIDQAIMNSFTTSDLVRVHEQTSIYRLTPDGDTGGKVLVNDMTGLDDSSVYTINNIDFGNYLETPAANLSRPYDVYKVIDGDTITVMIDGVNQNIRLIGINSPEVASSFTTTECFGAEASGAAKAQLTNKKVRLESDPASGNKDKYNRLLRYVYLEDGTLFNKWMIAQGYAYEYTYAGIAYKYQTDFKAAQTSAKTGQKGLWTDGVCKATTTPDTSGAYNCLSNVYNCTDFTTHTEAQAVYNYCMQKVGTDIHQLDSDKDGTVCENLN